ncbi:VOC family protein [Candidatus Uabimicrobium sp. HlEnr_7]|uniref:VOC family protein n=1 Tax=Candidatus Uabimicrobium helgolandensis TaxID=3095367 RepID=UPI0035564434
MVKYVHTNIIAKDWKNLASFYIEVFKCRTVPPERNQQGNWLSKGTGVANAHLQGLHLRLPGYGEIGPTLEIYSYSNMIESAKPPAANRQGFGHLAFEVEDVKQKLEEVISAKGKLLGEIVEKEIPNVGKITFVYATDPEGNILEIQNWDYYS